MWNQGFSKFGGIPDSDRAVKLSRKNGSLCFANICLRALDHLVALIKAMIFHHLSVPILFR